MTDVCNVLFNKDLGLASGGVFRGATTSYYEPRNSMIHACLASRVGLPITLSVILIAVCRRLGIRHVHGVGAPGHFVCKYQLPSGAEETDGQWIRVGSTTTAAAVEGADEGTLFYIDPHGGGAFIEPAVMRGAVASRVPVDHLDFFLKCASNLQVWDRICANLNHVYSAKLEEALISRSMGAPERNRLNLLRLTINSFQHKIRRQTEPPTRVVSAFAFDAALNSTFDDSYTSCGPAVPNATTLSNATRLLFLTAVKECRQRLQFMGDRAIILQNHVCPDVPTDAASPQTLPQTTRFRVGQVVKLLGSSDVGVVCGFARGADYYILWSGDQTMGLCSERELGTSFERSYTLVVKHHSLGRYFRKRIARRSGAPFYQPNATLLALYGPEFCMGQRDEDVAPSGGEVVALGEGYNQENAMRK